MSTFGAGGFACVCFVVCRHDFADCFSVLFHYFRLVVKENIVF